MNTSYVLMLDETFEQKLKVLIDSLPDNENLVSTAVVKDLFIIFTKKEELTNIKHRNLLLEELGKKIKK